jgi:NIPSNAP
MHMILEERDYRIKAGYVADFLWRYKDLSERTEKRARMLADERWPEYLSSVKG